MIGMVGLIVWAYAVARLLQIPVEYGGQSANGRAWLIVTSMGGILIASYGLFELFMAGNRAASSMQGLGQ